MSEKIPGYDFSKKKKSIKELLDTTDYRNYSKNKKKTQKRNESIYKFTSIGYSSPAVKWLIYINSLIFLLICFVPEIINYGAIYNISDNNFQPWQIITTMFLHGGFMHILFNMLTLWFAGNFLEKNIGTNKFLILYFVSGILSSILCLLISPLPAIGASGAICGVMAAMLFIAPESKVLLMFIFPIKLKTFIYGFTIFTLIFGVLSLIDSSYGFNTAHFGHLGGLIGGYLIMYYWKNKKLIRAY